MSATICPVKADSLPLRFETGRYIGEQVENRLCRLFDSGAVESEKEIPFYYNFHNGFIFSVLQSLIIEDNFTILSPNQPHGKLMILLTFKKIIRQKRHNYICKQLCICSRRIQYHSIQQPLFTLVPD